MWCHKCSASVAWERMQNGATFTWACAGAHTAGMPRRQCRLEEQCPGYFVTGAGQRNAVNNPLQLLCSCKGMQARTLRAGKFDAACTEQVYTSGQLWQMLAVPSPWHLLSFKPFAQAWRCP